MIAKKLQCLNCGNEFLHLEELTSVKLICPQCKSGWVYRSAINNEVHLKYKNIRTLKFRFDLFVEDAGGKYLADILFVSFLTFRFLSELNLHYFQVTLWLIKIISLRLLFHIFINKSISEVFLNAFKSIVDVSPGFLLLSLIGYLYHKFYLRSFSSEQLLVFSIFVSLLSSWLSIFLFAFRLKKLRDKRLLRTLLPFPKKDLTSELEAKVYEKK